MSNPPSGYNTPKTNWKAADVVSPTDMNRIEGNMEAHVADTSAHSATSAPTANRIMMRDANGRAQVAAPSASADIARKDNVDTVQNNLNAKMHPTTGHKHTGVAGDGPLLPIRLIDYKEYTSSGTWTKPAGAQFILVQCIGGGAGGNNYSGGGGGGNCMRWLRADIVPSSVSVTVGAGGGPGENGGNSSFGNATGIYVIGYGGYGMNGGGAGTNFTGSPAWGNLGAGQAGSSEYGGGGGGQGYSSQTGYPGGSSLWGGGGGGAGGGIYGSTYHPGQPGGSSGHGAVAAGSNGVGMFAGGGGNGGTDTGRGGNGGFPGGGGGGRGWDTPDNTYCGSGGAGVVRVWVW